MAVAITGVSDSWSIPLPGTVHTTPRRLMQAHVSQVEYGWSALFRSLMQGALLHMLAVSAASVLSTCTNGFQRADGDGLGENEDSQWIKLRDTCCQRQIKNLDVDTLGDLTKFWVVCSRRTTCTC